MTAMPSRRQVQAACTNRSWCSAGCRRSLKALVQLYGHSIGAVPQNIARRAFVVQRKGITAEGEQWPVCSEKEREITML